LSFAEVHQLIKSIFVDVLAKKKEEKREHKRYDLSL